MVDWTAVPSGHGSLANVNLADMHDFTQLTGTISSTQHGDLDTYDGHSGIYPGISQTETISGVWTITGAWLFQESFDIEGGKNIEFYSGSAVLRGKLIAATDEFRIRTNNCYLIISDIGTDHTSVVIETKTPGSGKGQGGVFPSQHEKGYCGYYAIGDAYAWYGAYAKYMFDDDGSLEAYSQRDDLGDLRAIKELKHPKTGKFVKGSWGDRIWDAGTIPYYIRSKKGWNEKKKRGYIKSSKFKGWMISLLKKLDERDLEQDEKIELALSEIHKLNKRTNQLEKKQ